MRKKLIVYCDDQKRFRDAFYERHHTYYDIVLVDDTRELPRKLEQLKKPDLVLLDLYHPREDDTEYAEKAAQAEVSLSKLDAQIEETRQAVLNAWEPSGLETLKLLREKFPPHKLPIAIFTQKGLLLLGDSELREAELCGADWLLKKALSARTEQIAIDRIIMRSPDRISNRTAKKYRYALGISLLTIILLVVGLLLRGNRFSEIVVAAVIAIASILGKVLTPREDD